MAVGLVLITYSLALVELETGESIAPLGIPLRINSPVYLGSGLVVASLWAMGRFLYYGVWKTESPTRKRTNRLKKLQQTKPTFNSREDTEQFVDNFRELYPRLPGLKIAPIITDVSVKLRTNLGGNGEESEMDSGVVGHKIEHVNIPFAIRMAARFEDADYFAPIWINLLALGSWCWRYFY